MRDNEGKDTDIFGFVSGEPVEFNIVQIGKAFMFDLKNTEKKASNEGVGANLLSDFQFRTLPVSDDSWKYILSQTETNFNNLRNALKGFKTQSYNEEVMIRYRQSDKFEDLKQAGCTKANHTYLAAYAEDFWTYSDKEDLSCSDSDPTGWAGCSVSGQVQNKCSFLPSNSMSSLSTQMCSIGVDNGFNCLVAFTDGSIQTPSLQESNSQFNLFKTPVSGARKNDMGDLLGTLYAAKGIFMRDLINIWTQESCDQSMKCVSTCYANSDDSPVGFCPNIFGPPYECDHTWAQGGAMECGTSPACEIQIDPDNDADQQFPDECYTCVPSISPLPKLLDDWLYLDNMYYKDTSTDGGGYSDTLSADARKRLNGKLNSRSKFNCIGHPYTNADDNKYILPVYSVGNGAGSSFPPGLYASIQCNDFIFGSYSPYGVLFPSSGEHAIPLNEQNHASSSGCSGRFCEMDGKFGPIVNRVNKTAFLEFVSMDNLKKKWSNFTIMLAPKTYCHPYSDELAMIHLLAKYGEFDNIDGENPTPLPTFMGAPHSGALNGWYDIISIDYGAPCDYPFMKHVPGYPDQPMKPCCVHAYTDEDTCKIDLQREAARVLSPGIATLRDPSGSNTDVTLLPWQELSCPLEVTIDDDRSPGMSLKQQFQSVSVSASKLVADQTGTMNALGRGCYMCVTPSVNKNLYETLNTKTNWLDHYDPVTCATKSVIPTMEFVPKSVDEFNSNFFNVTIDPTERFRPSRQFPTSRDEIAGVYTLYPYIDIPAQLPKEQVNDTTVQSNYQKLLSLQLKYYHDVDYHIKVEVTGTFA